MHLKLGVGEIFFLPWAEVWLEEAFAELARGLGVPACCNFGR